MSKPQYLEPNTHTLTDLHTYQHIKDDAVIAPNILDASSNYKVKLPYAYPIRKSINRHKKYKTQKGLIKTSTAAMSHKTTVI